MHKKSVLFSGTISSTYFYTCYTAINWENDVLRIGAAGSLATLIVDGTFHVVDTLNIRAKAHPTEISTYNLMKEIWAKEGLYGFGKGYTAMFYGSACFGFVYFSAYKYLKGLYRENKERKGAKFTATTSCFMFAAFYAELIGLSV